jgi:hypothetical protein
MRLFLKFSYQPDESTCGEVVQRIQNHFLDVYEVRKRWFKFDDSFMHKRRGSSSLIQKYPELKEFLYFTEREWGNDVFEEPVISNLDETWFAPNPFKNLGDIPNEMFVTIFRQIPRVYPFMRISLAYDLHITGALDSVPEKEYPLYSKYRRNFSHEAPFAESTLVMEGELKDKKYIHYLVFYLRLPNDVMFEANLPEISSSVMASIRGIGTIQKTEVFHIPDEVEFNQLTKKHAKAEILLGESGENLHSEMLGLKMPHQLPEPFFVLKKAAQNKSMPHNIPTKSIIQLSLGLKGYQYRPRLDTEDSINFGKSTKNHNSINAVFHFGAWSQKLSCEVIIRGLSWRQQIIIPVYPDYIQYPIISEASFKQAVENLTTVIVYLEREIIPRIEEIYGSSPKWFNASGDIYRIKK